MHEAQPYDAALEAYSEYDPQLLANPYPLYHQLRTEDPVHWSDALGCWLITRFDDVVSALRDHGRFSSNRMSSFMGQLPEAAQDEAQPLRDYLSKFIGLLDPPDHTRIRKLVHKAFEPNVVQRMRPWIQKIVDDLLDEVHQQGRMDVIRDLAYPLPVTVIARIIGLPEEDRAQFKKWSDDIVAFLGSGHAMPDRAEIAQRSMFEFTDYYRDIMAERRRNPKDDLISVLLAAEEDGEKLTEQELLATCVTLLAGGHETTTNLIGNGILALLRHPDELRKLKDDPSLVESAAEELLRYDTPIQRAERRAAEDIELRGSHIEKDQRVFLVVGAANRDPLEFPDPDRLDICREPNPHVAFGFGIHYCVGAPLARMEAPIAINAVLRRMPNMQLTGDTLDWHENLAIRGVKSLPVTF